DLNNAGSISKASKRQKGSQKITKWYQYYPNTKYGSRAKNIRFRFNMNKSNYIIDAEERIKGSQKIASWYRYAAKTKFGPHGKRITGRILNVPVIKQLPSLPTGCEITSITMMLRYKGAKVNEVNLAKEMPKH